MSGSGPGRTRAIVLVLFFLSGACTLVYELAWVRMFVLVFGTSVYAVSTVLSAFMAGLALGSALIGRISDRVSNPLRLYAWLELGIGLFALVFPFVLARLDAFYTVLYGFLEGSPNAFSLARFALSFLVLLVPTTLMGATLPVLSRFIVPELRRVGGSIGALYTFNTFGAVAGCVLTAFLLLEHAGVRGSTYLAAMANLLIAAAALALAARDRGPEQAGGRPETRAAKVTGREPDAPPHLARLVFWGFALSGFAALGYEVVWTRLLGVVLRLTTSQSLSTILIAFLFGLAVGGAIGARFADRWKALVAVFAALELALGLFGLVSVAVFAAIPDLAGAIPAAGFGGHMVRLFALAFVVMLPPTILMGLLFPVAGKIHVVGMESLGRRVGGIYAANTAGAIFGAFAAGFVLIPLAGTQASIQILAWINLAVGLALLLLDSTLTARTRLLLLGGLGAPALLLTVLLPAAHMENVFRKANPRAELLYYDEAAGGTVTVYEFPDGERILRVNGAGEVPTDRASIQIFRLLGTLPMALHPDPGEVMVIAFGGGITLSSVELGQPRRLDCVEIVPGVFEASRYFDAFNNGLHDRLESADINLIVADGRNHVLRTDRSYDVIISDSTHPGTADSWVLYTQEFYRLCAKRLNDGGLFAQWLPLHGLTVDGYKMILRTFQTVFPHATLWFTEEYSILLGAPEGLRIDPARIDRMLSRAPVRDSLRQVDLAGLVSFLATCALDEQAFAAYVGEGPVNTDDRPWISFASQMRSGGGGGAPITMSLLPFFGQGIDRYLPESAGPLGEAVARRQRARRHAFSGDLAFRRGERERALAELRRAQAIDPEDPETARIVRRVQRWMRERRASGR